MNYKTLRLEGTEVWRINSVDFDQVPFGDKPLLSGKAYIKFLSKRKTFKDIIRDVGCNER